ncbi:MAG: glutaminyl-tRNA synthase (glutamine-hydrolyzing) subunit A [Candidatus Magasanikbacteria bacterium RIFCSPHIGHO2_02_FULL_50_9b]|uniref:Glutamyl-tRNA(Gln) amidotransferase subunit A n=1 Tax=Candidatus Magasanikbacteria bacterium RIFCSPHIGHO2_02_FULL_50_9b TaxID=1798682 RepID=A0A1F6M7U5_9BACT|nr:MAG: glutaminyl-tRNA synthase (glutamine-hydrolyzing) subunit A [Candidatus Magasanikbacteria bacterium RIFCSPHIGHO2_02_FULL_50_9b]
MNSYSSLASWSDALTTRAVSAVEAVDYFSDRITKINPQLNAYITTDIDRARSAAADIDRQRVAGESLSNIAGIPFGVKDVIDTSGIRATGAAAILDNFEPTFDSTVIARLKNAGALVIGKHNCDAFGHGSSNEHSMYGAVKNPWDVSRVPGGSSGGSGAAVAADLCSFAIAEDTGGSVRAPASFCGVSGLKVSYGRNSRYGSMPMASSLDSIGPIAQTAEDIAIILQHIAGHDPLDATSAIAALPDYRTEIQKSVAGLKIGVPEEYFSAHLQPQIRAVVENALHTFEELGASLVPISLPHTSYAIATYYILVPCEDSSNLARLDGIRYGVRQKAADLYHTYTASRTQGFPDEVKRRIMLGTFALSYGYYDAYYLKAQRVRTLIRRDFDEAFNKVDVIMGPSAPGIAFKLGANASDPLQMYLEDAYVVPASLAGICALSVPCGFVDGMPVGLQIMGPRLKEELPLRFGHHYQLATSWHTTHPAL